MFITDLFNLKKVCRHEKISPAIETGYCPDCGKLIRNDWYIARCACCGIKLKAMERGGKLVAQEHYCVNCGSSEYIIEKLDKINYIDVNYAALKRTEVENEQLEKPFTTQCWQERTPSTPKLLIQYL